jgi:hypothetical protein
MWRMHAVVDVFLKTSVDKHVDRLSKNVRNDEPRTQAEGSDRDSSYPQGVDSEGHVTCER